MALPALQVRKLNEVEPCFLCQASIVMCSVNADMSAL